MRWRFGIHTNTWAALINHQRRRVVKPLSEGPLAATFSGYINQNQSTTLIAEDPRRLQELDTLDTRESTIVAFPRSCSHGVASEYLRPQIDLRLGDDRAAS